MYKKIVLTFILFLTITLLPNIVLADAENQVLEEKIGNKIVRVSYDQDKAGLGEPVPFSFALLQEDESAEALFDSLWLNIKPKTNPEQDLLIAEIQKANTGATGITYDFPQTGEYTFTVRYNQDNVVLAEHTFDFAISKEPPNEASIDKSANENIDIANTVLKDNLLTKYVWVATLIGGLLFGWIAKTLISRSS